MNFLLFKENRFLPPMTKISIHAMYAADDRSGSMRLLRILVSMTLFFNNSIYADNPAKEVKSLQTLSFEASGCAPEILRAIYSALDEEDKEKPTVISLENVVPMTEYAKMDGHLLYKDKYRKIRSLDLSNIGTDDLPGFIFKHMTNLEELNLSGNPNLNLNSETFKKLCQQLTELDVSYCNIDEYVFSIICKRCSKLKALKISENFNINLNSEEFKKLCQQLVVLDASNCNVDEDTFAVICSNCPKLKVLRMSNNPRIKFADQEPIKFKDTLEELKVDNCSLNTADMLKIAGLKSLERLDISNNWLKKYFEKLDFGNLRGTLTELKASKIGIALETLYKITECFKITVLDISHNNLKNEEYANPSTVNCNFLGSLTNQLISFNASKTNLSIIQLEEVLDSSSIKILDCSFNDFSGLDDTFKIGGAKSVLEDAKLSNCYLSSQRFLSEILNCSSLAKLDISRNNFEMLYNKFAFESPLKSLKWLNISESKINVRFFIEMLGEFETIEYLDISGESLTTSLRGLDHAPVEFDPSKVVSTIGGLKKSLKTLKASNCNIQNDYHLLCSLTDCENLEHLDISENNLSQFPTNFQFGSSRETLKCLNMNNCGYISLNTLKAVTDLKVLEVENTNNNKYETQDYFELGDSKNSLKVISMSGSSDSFNSSILQAISECRVLI